MIKTVLGTPEQNDVVEKMNRTLNERARCMRIYVTIKKKQIFSFNYYYFLQYTYKI